jgi:hypothetical protein
MGTVASSGRRWRLSLPFLGAIVALLFLAPAAQATFHLIKVREVFPGAVAHPDSSYVELQMYESGQNQVQLGQLEVFNATGSVTGTFTPSHSVANAANQDTVLIADSEYAAQFPLGPTPDFVDSSLNLSPGGGAVCWPQTEPPFDDCASWGNFSGQGMLASTDTSPAAPAGIPDGMALRRSIAGGVCSHFLENADDTDNSSVDFSVQPPNPRSNATVPGETECNVPTSTVDTRPAAATNATAAFFTYHSTPAGATFECRLDAAAFASCPSSGIEYPGPLSEATHAFEVRATNGNGTGGPASVTWTVDLTPPTATIDSHPIDPSPGASAAFVFHASEVGSTFQCSLAKGAEADSFATCSSGKTYKSLVNGAYTFKVRAKDQATNQGAATSFTWTVDNSLLDTTPPETTIKSHPSDPSNSPSASFAYESNEAGSTFECKLDGAAFASCPATGVAYSNLTNGSHSFQVRAKDPSGNVDPTPAGYSFSVVAMMEPGPTPIAPPTARKPDTTISPKPAAKTHDRTPTLRFKSTVSGSTFECKLDGKPFKPCRSPFTTKSLGFGQHAFKVRASAGGATDPTPASASFKVVRG